MGKANVQATLTVRNKHVDVWGGEAERFVSLFAYVQHSKQEGGGSECIFISRFVCNSTHYSAVLKYEHDALVQSEFPKQMALLFWSMQQNMLDLIPHAFFFFYFI